jgi:hypothetical protein
LTLALAALRVLAQSGAPPPPALTPEEQAEIQRALQEDAAAAAGAKPAQPLPATPEAATASAPGGEAPMAVGGPPPPSLNPDLSLIADVAGSVFSVPLPLETGEHDPHASGFTVQQLELAASAAVDPYFTFNSFLVFKVPRPDGTGGTEPGGVEIEEVYATSTSLPANLQLRAGQFLTRFGRFNPTHPHTWDFVDQPLIIGDFFGPDGNRGVGAELSYLTPLPFYSEALLSVTQDSAERIERLGELQFLLALKQFFALSDDWSLATGASGLTYAPPPDLGIDRTWIAGVDGYLKYRPVGYASFTIVSLWAEWFLRRRDLPGTTLTDTGGFAQVFWRYAQRWAAAARYELGTPSWNSQGIREADCPDAAGLLDPQCAVLQGGSVWQRLAVNATFWPTEFSRVRLQGSLTLAGFEVRATYGLMLAFEFSVGPHGAHAF